MTYTKRFMPSGRPGPRWNPRAWGTQKRKQEHPAWPPPPHKEQSPAPGHLGRPLLLRNALRTRQQAGPQGLCRQRSLHRTQLGPATVAMSCHGKDPTDLVYEGWAWGRAPVLWKSQNWGGGESWEGSLLHLGLPGLVSQGADFTTSQ